MQNPLPNMLLISAVSSRPDLWLFSEVKQHDYNNSLSNTDKQKNEAFPDLS